MFKYIKIYKNSTMKLIEEHCCHNITVVPRVGEYLSIGSKMHIPIMSVDYNYDLGVIKIIIDL